MSSEAMVLKAGASGKLATHMSAQLLEAIFTGSAVLGTILLLLSSLGAGFHIRLHVPVHAPRVHLPFVHVSHGDGTTGLPMVLGFLALFGIGGLMGGALDLGPLGATVVAAVFGAFGSIVAFTIFALLRRAEGTEPTTLAELVGRRARVSVSIAPTTPGAVTLVYDGAVQTLPASANAAIARGHEVEILAVRGVGGVIVRFLPPP